MTGTPSDEHCRRAVAGSAEGASDGPAQDDCAGLRPDWDRPVAMAGIVFALVVLGQSLAEDQALVTGLTIASWSLWAFFVAEFAWRAFHAADQRRFWSRNWWQVVFLLVPFLRFFRSFSAIRLGRAGRVVSATVRSSRSAGQVLSSRVAWLGSVTAVVALGSGQVLYVVGSYDEFADALHDSALATVTGEPLSASGDLARFLEVGLAVYSVAVFAAMAGATGAYFLRDRSDPGTDRP